MVTIWVTVFFPHSRVSSKTICHSLLFSAVSAGINEYNVGRVTERVLSAWKKNSYSSLAELSVEAESMEHKRDKMRDK